MLTPADGKGRALRGRSRALPGTRQALRDADAAAPAPPRFPVVQRDCATRWGFFAGGRRRAERESAAFELGHVRVDRVAGCPYTVRRQGC